MQIQQPWILVIVLLVGCWVGMCLQAYINRAKNRKLARLTDGIRQLDRLASHRIHAVSLIVGFLHSKSNNDEYLSAAVCEKTINDLCADIAYRQRHRRK